MDRRRLPVPDRQIIVRCVTGTVRTLMTATTAMRSRRSTIMKVRGMERLPSFRTGTWAA